MFCSDPEGWGPISRDKEDFTPCFADLTVDIVSLGLILLGSLNLASLLKQTAYPVPQNWHYYLKLVLVGLLLPSTALFASLQFGYFHNTLADIRFWTPLIECLAIAFAFTIHHYEHKRSTVPSGVLLFYWPLYIVVNGIKLHSLAVREGLGKTNVSFILLAICEGAAAAVFLLEYMIPKARSEYQTLEDDQQKCPMEESDIFSILTFGWMTPLMKAGYKKFLTEDDLWNVRRKDTTQYTEEQFTDAWQKELKKHTPNLWIALARAFGGPYIEGALYKVVQDLLNYSQPQLLRYLIAFISSYKTDKPQPVSTGLAIAGVMFIASVVQTVTLHQYFQHAFEVGMRIRSALTAAIYKKSMRLSNEGRASKSTGDIVNLQAVDTQRLQDITTYGQQIWSSPFQIILCMVSLYSLLGPSMFAGIGVMLLMIPINGFAARVMKNLQRKQMKNKDTRTRLMTEILNNMKSIKLYSWGQPFMKKLNHVRNDLELHTLKKIGVAQTVASFTWSTTPFLVSCMTFTVFVLTQDKPLTTDIVFPALTLFNLLSFPLSVLPMVITAVVEAGVAVDRITSFLTAEEIQSDAVKREESVTRVGEESVRMTNGTFTWNKYEGQPILENINFSARKGELACVVGRVGQGKSSFLQALIGDLYKLRGEVTLRGNIAYVAQQNWVMNATVRENIVFGHKFDSEFYQKTVSACALLEDFDSLPDGDETEVGEKGISLSGGQKARLTLARAVYARADIYILDDPLSAVDQHVGRHLIDNVLGPRGLLAGKTRIMATNSIPVLMEANYIYLLVKGQIVESGTYESVMATKAGIYNIIRHMKDTTRDDRESDDTTMVASGTTTTRDVSSEEDEVPDLAEVVSVATLRRASIASVRNGRNKIIDEENAKKTTQTKEFSEQGKVKWSVYIEYAKSANLFAVGIYLATMIGAQVAQVAGNVWLKEWSDNNTEHGRNAETGKYIGIYFAFGFGAAALVMAQTLILWLLCAIEAAKILHHRMAVAIFRSPMSFFDTTPAGRILNRFSSDIYRIDEVLARTFNMLFANSVKSLSTLVIISISTPPFVAVIIPLTFLYIYIQRYYLRTSRELKRLDSVSRSPIYAHFQESLGGISTIRAYQQADRFERENERRVDANLRAFFPSINANRWLAIRLEFIGSIIILAAASFACISVASGSGLSAGWVGLAMSYALQITQSLNWIVRQSVEVETNIVSVERVLEYSALPSEAPEVIPDHRPPSSWPANGAVSFNHYSTRYRAGLDLVLKDINLDIKPREKIGIVGRTGAGKSSLTLALFRIIEKVSGNISIDDLNTSTIGLQDLRQRLAIIPQDASLFEGTVRDNLDPSHVHDDTELWAVLELSHLKDHVTSMDGKLDAKINEGGSNLSVGQRSLVSLARALLTPSNILVIDEATAAVDVETDTVIQQTIREKFKERTILTIAHRLNTIIDSDRILVLSAGRVAEFDTPANLIEKKNSLFYSLVKEAGLLEPDTAVRSS
ncbi:putative ABC metal ion transporter [Terfezia boudieri ATCC MYA-4762]|uniref:Putative ABC metal ion transporter n=1 Tax=Terfezia boudieri ATCC MYA-4762 TaxID=1051890 RepID=A0A3N4LVM5_9PEZI|nr:putative ABC metal ion transporter [Terfezia boudieri ATCC MYA-4762]